MKGRQSPPHFSQIWLHSQKVKAYDFTNFFPIHLSKIGGGGGARAFKAEENAKLNDWMAEKAV